MVIRIMSDRSSEFVFIPASRGHLREGTARSRRTQSKSIDCTEKLERRDRILAEKVEVRSYTVLLNNLKWDGRGLLDF